MRPDAVTRGSDGYLRVYYDRLGLKFRTYRDWLAGGAADPRAIEDLTMTRHHSLCPFDLCARPGASSACCALAAPEARAQQAFQTPEEAAAALAAAVKSGARKDIVKVLGRDAEDIVSSGDEVADNETRERFRPGLRRQALDQGGGRQEGRHDPRQRTISRSRSRW